MYYATFQESRLEKILAENRILVDVEFGQVAKYNSKANPVIIFYA